MIPASRADILFRAKIAEKAERYLDSAKAMKAAAETGLEFTVDMRNLFSLAYKHSVGRKRMAWRVLSSIEQKFEGEDIWKYDKTQQYREKIQSEIVDICNEVNKIIDTYLMKLAQNDESKVFYLKMKADYFRYQSEVVGDPEHRRKIVSSAEKYYREATEIAEKALRAAHPIRLGVALNYSVFLYEVKAANKRAIKLAKETFDEAVEEFNTGILATESYKESSIVLQLLKDNVLTWSALDGPAVDLLPES